MEVLLYTKGINKTMNLMEPLYTRIPKGHNYLTTTGKWLLYKDCIAISILLC